MSMYPLGKMLAPSLQASPGAVVRGLLEDTSAVTGTICVPKPARESSLAHWQKADGYYYCNIARVKRIWQVCTLFTVLLPCEVLSNHAARSETRPADVANFM